MEQNMNYKPVGYSPMDKNEAQQGLKAQPLNQSNNGQYNLSDNQYSQLGKDLWTAANSQDMYGKGWQNISDFGGSDKYQFAYDDSTDIGKADYNDLSRWLYVRQANNPNQVQKYNLFNADDPNIDMTQLGQRILGGGDNWLTNFWNQSYGWGQQQQPGSPQVQPPGSPQVQPPGSPQVQPPTYPDQPPITPPGGIRPDQGVETMPDGSVRVPGTDMGSPTVPDDATNVGMGAALKALQNMFNNPQYYPDWYGNDYQKLDTSKWQNAYPEFLNVPGYEGIDIPGQYQGLMEGDFNRLEESLRQPGEIAAQNAFQQGGDYLKNVMGGSGLYGSSVMGNQANNNLNQKYMDTMASNAAQAAAQRYGLQQNDLQFGANYGLQRGDLSRQNALDQYKAAMTSRNLLNDYNNNRFQFDYGLGEAARGERNNLLQNRYQYDLASQAWRNALNENLMNAGLALAGKSGNLANANRNYSLAQQQYNDQSRQNQVGFWMDIANRSGLTDKVKSGVSSIFDNWHW